MDLITLLLGVATLVNTVLGLLLIFNAKKNFFAELYAFNVLMIISWSGSMVLFRLSDSGNIDFTTQFLYISATLIASTFLYFSFVFPNTKTPPSLTTQLAIFIPNILLVLGILFSDHIIEGVMLNPTGENIVFFGPWFPLYIIYILSFFSYGFWVLFKKFLHTKEHEQKLQIIYLVIGYAISANISFITNLILPWLGYYELNWVGQVSTVTMVSFATIAILRHKLFSMKVIVTELFVFALWLFIFIRMLLSTDVQGQITDGLLLVVSVIFGMLLIKGVLKEVEAREEIERLAKDLEKANTRLRELDRQKSEFVSIASHQLRSPLTAIEGYASMLLEGSFGTFPEKAKEAVSRIFESSKLMAASVEDFLNVSRIEQGRMKYDKVNTDLKKLAQTVVDELLPVATKKKIDLSFSDDGKEPYTAHADIGKIKQVFSNLVDNAIKYTPKGTVSVHIAKHDNKIRFSVKDSGVGISKETVGKLFDKFIRARNAHEVNVSGTGLGLYVAKQMVDAHDGKIWVESDGEGKGSTFFVELPSK